MAKITLFAQVIQRLPKEIIKPLAKRHEAYTPITYCARTFLRGQKRNVHNRNIPLKSFVTRDILTYYTLLNAINDISDVIVRDIRTCRQAESHFEETLTHTIHIRRSILIDRLLVHRFPQRTALHLL